MFGNPLKTIEKCKSKLDGEKLAKFTTHKNAEVKLAAIDALGVCKKNEDAYNALVLLINDKDPAIRAHAIASLGVLGDMKARAHIEHRMTRESDASVQKAIEEALKTLHGREDD